MPPVLSMLGCQARFWTSACPTRQSRRMHVRCLLKRAEGCTVQWSQNLKDLTVRVNLDRDTRAKDIQLDIRTKRLALLVNGAVQLEGTYDHPTGVDPDESFWEIEDDSKGRALVITMRKKEIAMDTLGYEAWTRLLEDDRPDMTITHRVFFDVKIGRKEFGRIVFALYGRVAPRTVENFRSLCTSEPTTSERGIQLTYKGSRIFRIMPGFLIHGGDIVHNDGSGGESVYGGPFPDENFALRHNKAGVLAMANTGPNTNTSQFHILLGSHSFMDGKHVVFGEVISGMDIVALIEKVPTSNGDRPTVPVEICNCGELSETEYSQWMAEKPKETVTTTASTKPTAQIRPNKIDIDGKDWSEQ